MENSIKGKLDRLFSKFCSNNEEITQFGLLDGKIGISFCKILYGNIIQNDDIKNKGFSQFEKVFETFKTTSNLNNSFCSGLTGIGYLLDLMAKNDLIEYEYLILSEIDNIVFSQLRTNLSIHNLDYLHGAIGQGLYFINRLSKSLIAQNAIELIIEYLVLNAEESINGEIKWKFIVDFRNYKFGYNISLSHGLSSLIIFLERLIKSNYKNIYVEKLFYGTIKYILNQKLNYEKVGSHFPSLYKEAENLKSRLAWCYGDLGISSSLWQAGNTINNHSLKQLAIDVLINNGMNRIDLNKESVFDSCLCHGSSGIGLIYYRMFLNTNLSEFKNFAKYWFDKTIQMGIDIDGDLNYKYWNPELKNHWKEELNILEGLSGIILALTSYYYEQDPFWDNFLLLS